VFGNGHVRLIAVSVLVTILVKQLVDYQFNTLTEQIFVTEDAITRFQGLVNALIQGLPLVSVLVLRPLLRRWGVGAAVFLLPGLMLVTGLGMAVFFGLWTVIAVRAADTTFRYSADRAGREILYVPVPDDIKLKAKTYIDVGIEKGLGKAAAAGLLFVLVELLALDLRQIAYLVVALTAAWLALTFAIRREYVRTLARSIRGRFASFQGLSALADASTQSVVRQALTGDDPLESAFALDLVEQATGRDRRAMAGALNQLLEHRSAEVRRKALGVLSRDPENLDLDRAGALLEDGDPQVREAAIRGLVQARSAEGREPLIRDMVRSPDARIRTAALSVLARGELPDVDPENLGEVYLEEHWDRAVLGDREARVELALAAGTMRADPMAGDVLEGLLSDPDPEVVSAALRSAGLVRRRELHPAMIAALRAPTTREAAREALAEQGELAVDSLEAVLMDELADPVIRRHLPSVLARIPHQRAADVLLYSVVAPETDQILDYRALKALSSLRLRHPELGFDRAEVLRAVDREVAVAERYDGARRTLRRTDLGGPVAGLFGKALDDAWSERQEGVFRLLGLLYPPDSMRQCHLALSGASTASRGNALEWLEET
ncbi:MAG TPA: Npt1/Npt2 family nucleotide transporter, partial [Longimicrobiales bacterium]|nr:Npt1/Npt2 family nucleotide transporter [Longimicrobiales bacterium]